MLPLVLLLLNLVSFGLLLPWLGFYWDDWPSIWFLHFLGPQGFMRVFAEDRPFLGGLFWLTTSILGESPLRWQIFAILVRWISSIALWWCLRLLWPGHRRAVDWTAILFALYPGFSQQFIAVTYSHVFLILALFLFSLGSMIQALQQPRRFWLWYPASWLSAIYSLFTVEYFFGLELLRPILMWLILSSEKSLKLRFKRTLTNWLPYLIGLVAFLFWRIILYPSPRGELQIFSDVSRAPLNNLLELLTTIVGDVFQVSILVWLQTANPLKLGDFGLLTSLLYGVVVLVTGTLAFVWLKRTYAAEAAPIGWSKQALSLGLVTLLLAGWPFWSTDLPIELRFPWDRFTLAFMLGSSLIVAGLINLIKPYLPRVILLGALIGLAVGQHFYTANLYRREWQTQRNLFWQLIWRAPGIQPGSLLITSKLPFVYYSDNSLTAPLNWIYAPESLSQPMPYLVYDLEARLGEGLSVIEAGQNVILNYRATYFEGNTSQALVFYYAPPGCVKILDPGFDASLPQKPKYIGEALHLSRPDLIQVEAHSTANVSLPALAPEPQHGWCYYFEQAELARQRGDWPRLASLADQARALGQRLYEVNAPELLPFIEGYAQLGRWEDARQLSLEALRLSPRMERSLCDMWERSLQQIPSSPGQLTTVISLAQTLPCLKQ